MFINTVHILYRSLFLTAGNDGCIKLYNLLEKNSIKHYDSYNYTNNSNSYSHNQNNTFYSNLTCIKFSPVKPTIFAVSSMDGMVYFYDLYLPVSTPIHILDSSTALETYNSTSNNNQTTHKTD